MTIVSCSHALVAIVIAAAVTGAVTGRIGPKGSQTSRLQGARARVRFPRRHWVF
jgi:hypothetical protein